MENLKQGLSPKEVKTIQMALAMMIEDLEATSKDGSKILLLTFRGYAMPAPIKSSTVRICTTVN